MEALMSDVPDQPNSFGIKKVVDCKIGEGGQQMYKVEWEATWEPAETLVTCQHLINEFWSFVNKAKANEQVGQQYRKRAMLERNTNNVKICQNDQNFNRMSDDDKTEVQRLLSRTNATSVGSPMLMSPSNMLMETSQHDQENNLMAASRTPTHSNNQNFPKSPHTPQDTKGKFSAKADFDSSTQQEADAKQNLLDGKSVSTAGLKYLENFTNPYVKIIVVCKVCNKEQSLKFASYWKQHAMTHSDTKPHQCPHCSKSFSRPVLMRKHMESKHGVAMGTTPKQEQMTTQDHFKEEQYPY